MPANRAPFVLSGETLDRNSEKHKGWNIPYLRAGGMGGHVNPPCVHNGYCHMPSTRRLAPIVTADLSPYVERAHAIDAALADAQERVRRAREVLAEARRDQAAARQERVDLAAAMRKAGASWSDIGKTLGVTSQRAIQLAQQHETV